MNFLKIIASSALCLLPLMLSAQVDPDTLSAADPGSGAITHGYLGNTNSSLVSFIDELKYDAGFRTGISRSTLTIDPKPTDTNTKAGTGVVIGAYLEIIYNSYLSLEINYAYSRKVSKFQFHDLNNNFYTGTFINEYFSLPIFIKAKTDADLKTGGKPIEIYAKAGIEYNSLQHARFDLTSPSFRNLSPPLILEKFGNDITEDVRSHEINLALSPGLKIHVNSASYLNFEGRWTYPLKSFLVTGGGEEQRQEYYANSFQILFGIGTHLN